MTNKEKMSTNLDELEKLLKSPIKFDYSSNIVKSKNTQKLDTPFKNNDIKNKSKTNNKNENKTQKLTQKNNNINNSKKYNTPIISKVSSIEGLLGKKRNTEKKEMNNVLRKIKKLNNENKDLKSKDLSDKKEKSEKDSEEEENIENKEDLFLKAIGRTKENMEKEYEESKKEREKKSTLINELLQRNLMGNKKREFITQKEEEKERLEKENEIKNNYQPIDLKLHHIGPIRKNNIDKYRNFRPALNDIFKNVLSFDFYNNETKTEEIPNTFENEAHYRFIWITNFFNELKYCLLNEKIDKSEIENYEKSNIKLNLLHLQDIDNKLTKLKINPNKKLYELKKRILKDNDIIAVFREKSEIDQDKITLKNEYELNYFLGIVIREHDNDLNLLVLRDDYEKTENSGFTRIKDYVFYDKKIKYLGSLNSPLREYKALLDLKLSNFTGIIKTDTIFLNYKDDDIDSKPDFSINYYLSEKETFIQNLQNSKLFNESQKKAIYRTNKMKKNDILLIQGPPGTGKTHTIMGLISLLLKNEPKTKILICAPSNAAIDEICARLANKGVYNSKFENIKCNFLRFGLYDRKDKEKKYLETLNGKILEKYSLEYLSDQKYKKDIDNLSEKLENLRRQLNNYNEDKDKNIAYIKNTESEISLCLKLYADKRYQRSLFEHEILVTTPILCTTLNNAGNERLKKANLAYEYLIIDEASQCVEPSCLIPFFHEVKKLILIGDHMQLPATVFYPKASKILYNRSLFERLIDNKYPRYILTVQYRMQSNISKFISEVFYDNKLTNDQSYIENLNKEPFYSLIKIENNFSFFNISYGEELFEERKKSYFNESEIEFCLILLKQLITLMNEKVYNYDNKNENKDEDNIKKKEVLGNTLNNYKYAIICPYKSQVVKLRDCIKSDIFFKNKKKNDIEINTVDSFQGQERDIVIFSTVRANFKVDGELEDGEIPSSTTEKIQNNNNNENIGIGFLNDFRRMNVGLSRAKYGCFVVGHFETLKNNLYWEKLMKYCQDKKSFFNVEKSKEKEAIQNIFK